MNEHIILEITGDFCFSIKQDKTHDTPSISARINTKRLVLQCIFTGITPGEKHDKINIKIVDFEVFNPVFETDWDQKQQSANNGVSIELSHDNQYSLHVLTDTTFDQPENYDVKISLLNANNASDETIDEIKKLLRIR